LIDDFRKEIANFFAIPVSMNKEFTIEKCYDMLNSTSSLILYLFDSEQPPGRELVEKLRKFQTMSIKQKDVKEVENIEKFGNKMGKIMTLATTIILIEQKKI
jgi:hypothetical protein